MRHGKIGRKLGRKTANRKALMMNLASSLIQHKKIRTTDTKAKELRSFIEPLITIGKEDTVANRRHVFSKLRSEEAVAKIFTKISVNAKERKGGYTRIIKAGFRAGDKADMAFIELVDRELEEDITAEPELKEEESVT